MGLFDGAKRGILDVSMFSGIPRIPKDFATRLTLLDNGLHVRERLHKKNELLIPYEKITAVAPVNKEQIITKDKSVIGRGIVGGVLLGPVGAIVGGMSGFGTKQVNKRFKLLIMNIKSTYYGDDVIAFRVVGATMGLDQFIEDLKHRANIA